MGIEESAQPPPHPLARRLSDGRILLRRFGRERDGTITDGAVVLDRSDPSYSIWDAALARWETDRPSPAEVTDFIPLDYRGLSFRAGDGMPPTHSRFTPRSVLPHDRDSDGCP